MARGAFRVIWTEVATSDLEEIVSYIALDSKSNARKILARIRGKAKSLRSFPERGRFVPEFLQFGLRTWRELIVGPYRIFYRIVYKKVLVSAVLDGRRDLQDVLLSRLLRNDNQPR